MGAKFEYLFHKPNWATTYCKSMDNRVPYEKKVTESYSTAIPETLGSLDSNGKKYKNNKQ